MDIVSEIRERLLAQQDLGYQRFRSKLMPGIPTETIIGVRMPVLRKLAGEYARHPDIQLFLRELPHRYYEEYNLHGILICRERDFDRTIQYLDAFLPYVDNWATCDILRPVSFQKHLTELLPYIDKWLSSGETYTIRFAIEMLMSFYLEDGHFSPAYPQRVADVVSDEYYVKMMIAWYFATALAKQYHAVIPYLEEQKLPKWTHNKTIRKAIESFRITDEQKTYLRTLIVR